MSENEKRKEAPTWEILAAIVGYFTSVESVVTFSGHLISDHPKEAIPYKIRVVSSLVYAVLMIVVSSWTLIKFKKPHESETSIHARFKRAYRKAQLLQAVRTLGFSLIRDVFLQMNGVRLYSSFNRYEDWPQRPELFDHIDRFNFGNKTIELQYYRDFNFIEFKETVSGGSEFGTGKKVRWGELENKILTISSPTGFYWTIRHLFKCNRA